MDKLIEMMGLLMKFPSVNLALVVTGISVATVFMALGVIALVVKNKG